MRILTLISFSIFTTVSWSAHADMYLETVLAYRECVKNAFELNSRGLARQHAARAAEEDCDGEKESYLSLFSGKEREEVAEKLDRLRIRYLHTRRAK